MSDPKITRTGEYYQLLIDRFTQTGLSPRQKAVYGEIKQLVLECSSLEEIQDRMKNEGYHEKPGQALYLDKMAALARAAEENGHTELAKIYQERYAEVEADYGKAFITGYEQRVSAYLSKQGSTLSALYDIFMNYLYWYAEDIYTKNAGGTRDKINEACNTLQKLGTSFEEAAADPYFRKHIDLPEDRYAAFVQAVAAIRNAAADAAAQAAVEEEFGRVWAIIKDKKGEIQEIGRNEAAKSKRSVCMVVPPEDASGAYEFADNQQEAT